MKNNYQKDLFGEVNDRYLNTLEDNKFALEFSRHITKIKNSDNPFLLASDYNEHIKIAFGRYFNFSSISFKEFQQLDLNWQIQLLIIQMFSVDSIKSECFCDRVLAQDNVFFLFFDWKLLGSDKFKLIWFNFIKEGMHDSLVIPGYDEIAEYDTKYNGLYELLEIRGELWDFYYHTDHFTPYFLKDTALLISNFSEFVKYLGPCNVNIFKQGWGHWKKYDFIRLVAQHGIKYLKHGPPSFHKNKTLHKKLLAEFPEYYKYMKNRSLKKDKDIVSTVIKANPDLIDTIPRQYIDTKMLNPFNLAEIAADKPQIAKKLDQPFLGIVCITGKLKTYKTKKEASIKLELAGYVVSKNLTKECSFLINEFKVKSAKSLKLKNWEYSHIEEIHHIDILLNNNHYRNTTILN